MAESEVFSVGQQHLEMRLGSFVCRHCLRLLPHWKQCWLVLSQRRSSREVRMRQFAAVGLQHVSLAW